MPNFCGIHLISYKSIFFPQEVISKQLGGFYLPFNMAHKSGLYKSSRLLWHEVHLLNETTILSQDLCFRYNTALTYQIHSYQSVAYGTLAHPRGPPYFASVLWHAGTPLRPTIFCLWLMLGGTPLRPTIFRLVCLQPDQSAGQ